MPRRCVCVWLASGLVSQVARHPMMLHQMSLNITEAITGGLAAGIGSKGNLAEGDDSKQGFEGSKRRP